MGIEPEKITESLDGDGGSGKRIHFQDRLLEKDLQCFPGATAETGKKFPVVKEITPEHLRDAENKMPVGNLLENIHAQPFPEFHHALLVAGRAEVAEFAGEGQEVFVAAIFAFDAGKAIVQIPAIEVPVNDLLQIRTPEAILPGKMIVIDLNESLEAILYTAVVIRVLRVSLAINSGRK